MYKHIKIFYQDFRYSRESFWNNLVIKREEYRVFKKREKSCVFQPDNGNFDVVQDFVADSVLDDYHRKWWWGIIINSNTD
jgi:hypothetical protein